MIQAIHLYILCFIWQLAASAHFSHIPEQIESQLNAHNTPIVYYTLGGHETMLPYKHLHLMENIKWVFPGEKAILEADNQRRILCAELTPYNLLIIIKDMKTNKTGMYCIDESFNGRIFSEISEQYGINVSDLSVSILTTGNPSPTESQTFTRIYGFTLEEYLKELNETFCDQLSSRLINFEYGTKFVTDIISLKSREISNQLEQYLGNHYLTRGIASGYLSKQEFFEQLSRNAPRKIAVEASTGELFWWSEELSTAFSCKNFRKNFQSLRLLHLHNLENRNSRWIDQSNKYTLREMPLNTAQFLSETSSSEEEVKSLSDISSDSEKDET